VWSHRLSLPSRLLITGFGVAQLRRHIEYALALGIEVLHIGRAPLYTVAPSRRYSFAPLAENASDAANSLLTNAEEYWADLGFASDRLSEIAADFRPDLIHAIGMDFLAYVCAQAGLQPLVVSAHGFLEYLVYSRQATLLERDRSLLSTAAALLIEPPMQAELCRTVVPAGVRVHEFCTGVDGRIFRPATAKERASWRKALHLPTDATVVLSSRGWGPTYHHERVLSAFAAALSDLPAPAYLLFHQLNRSTSPQRSVSDFESVQAQTEAIGLANHVRWLPAVPPVSMAMFYNLADIVVSYRIPDTFPSTVLEALACARPVIAPRLATFRGSVIEQECTLVEPDNTDALAAAMVDLANRPPAAEVLAAQRTAVLEKYDVPIVVEKLADIYADAVQH